jgi:apolipoprotein N-acyltransferase
MFDSTRLRQAFGRGYLFLVVCSEITLYWISGWHSDDTFLKIGGLATVLVHPLFLLLPVLIVYGISRYKKGLALLLFPLIMVGYEYFDNIWQFSFPWLELGNTETYNLNRIQYIEYVGVHGISFLICVITSILYFLIDKISSRKWGLLSAHSIALYVILLVLILFPNFYSNSRLSEDNSRYMQSSDSSKIINISIGQTNTDPFKKWSSSHDPLIEGYISKLREELKYNPDIMLLHETATPYYFLEDYNLLKSKRFSDISDSSKKYLIMGIPHIEYYEDSTKAQKDSKKMSHTGRWYDTYNSVILIEPGKHLKHSTIHKKVKLVPFSERTPYQEHLTFLKDLIKWGVGISSWQRGQEMILFNINNPELNIHSKFAALICFESVFSEYVSNAVKDGAEFFVIVTNDGWWGDNAGPEQHNQYAILRAIENRKWIARCAQTGVSCFIDPMGNVYDRIPYWTEGVINRNIIANSEKTFYANNGDIIGRIGFYTGILSFIACFIIYVYNRKVRSKA